MQKFTNIFSFRTLRTQIVSKPETPPKKETENCLQLKKCLYTPTNNYHHEKVSPPAYQVSNDYETYRNVLENNNNNVTVSYGTNFANYSTPQGQYQQQPYTVDTNCQTVFGLNDCSHNFTNVTPPYPVYQDVTSYYKYTYAEDIHTGSANGVYMAQI